MNPLTSEFQPFCTPHRVYSLLWKQLFHFLLHPPRPLLHRVLQCNPLNNNLTGRRCAEFSYPACQLCGVNEAARPPNTAADRAELPQQRRVSQDLFHCTHARQCERLPYVSFLQTLLNIRFSLASEILNCSKSRPCLLQTSIQQVRALLLLLLLLRAGDCHNRQRRDESLSKLAVWLDAVVQHWSKEIGGELSLV